MAGIQLAAVKAALAAVRCAVHAVHVRGRSAEIVDVSLELRVPGQPLYLGYYVVLGARYYPVPLVEGYGAEGAPAKAAPVRHHREPGHVE